jgi:hypothetical protein
VKKRNVVAFPMLTLMRSQQSFVRRAGLLQHRDIAVGILRRSGRALR